MRTRLLAVTLLTVVLTGCGTGTSDPTASTAVATRPVATFFLHDGILIRATVQVPDTAGIATAALEALLAGPPVGDVSAIPTDTRLVRLAIADGAATATFSGVDGLTRSAQAQIVSTLTRFPTVHSVAIRDTKAGSVTLQDASGAPLARPATVADYADLTADATIVVTSPARDSSVSSPVRVAGTAVVFEATFRLEVWRGATKLETKSIMASSGAPERGTWATMLDLPAGDIKLVLYEPSAEDGRPLHTTTVLLHVS
ncbi:MAG: Gmad2 immunoglobulin-like domain-containing protein [Actinomycetes bacterium]